MNSKRLLLLIILAVGVLWFYLPWRSGFPEGKQVGSDFGNKSNIAERSAVNESSDMEETRNVSPENRQNPYRRERDVENGLPDRGRVEDGRLSQSETVEARLREMVRRDDEGLVVETMPDGHQSIHLQGRFQHVTRLIENADGEMVAVCGGVLAGEEGEEAGE